MRDKLKNVNRFLINQSVQEFSNGIGPGGVILDVGAGNGHYRPLFKSNTYMAIDRGLEQNNTSGLDVVGDICILPFRSYSIDNALCAEVLEHVWDSEKLFRELNRILKPNGRLLLTTPLCFGEHMQPYDFFRYTRFSLSRLLRTHGFEVLRIEPRGGYFTLLGYLLAKAPDQIAKAENIPSFLKMLLKKLLRVVFTYFLGPVLQRFDYLDSRKAFTLGYLCEARKVPLIKC
jgi:SAM-dependent methyltransferase